MTNIANHLDAPIPGQSWTQPLGQAAWQHPPKFVKLDDAANFIFDRLVQPNILHQIFAMMKQKVSIEALARIIIFAGFHQGLWTPDLGMLLSRPVVFMLSGIAERAGIKAKVTHVDRSGLKQLAHFHTLKMNMSDPVSNEPPEAIDNLMKGLMAPSNGSK